MAVSTLLRRLALPLACGALALAPAPAAADDLVYAKLASYFEALRTQNNIPGLAVAIAGRTDLVWVRGFGYQNLERLVAMRPDTPVPVDGLTETFTATILLRCDEEHTQPLDDLAPTVPASSAAAIGGTTSPVRPQTIRQVLQHSTVDASDQTTYAYRPDRVAALQPVVEACRDARYEVSLADLFNRAGMTSSVPGTAAAAATVAGEGYPDDATLDRYRQLLARRATMYEAETGRRPAPVTAAPTPLTPAQGAISTAVDLALFDISLRSGAFASADTLVAAWRPPVDAATGRALPRGTGWFVQAYNGETVVWQVGQSDAGSSSLLVSLPARGLTLAMVANSAGLSKPFALTDGDITRSPFARVFLSLFTR